MTAFLAAMLPPDEVYDLLVADFADDGHPVSTPMQLILDDPPAGLGYGTVSAAQAFLNSYVNTDAGRARYRLSTTTRIIFTKIPTPPSVGHLAWLIHQSQVPQP